MKWIKTAIGAVIAISVVPFVVLSVIDINKSLGKVEYEEITYTIGLDYFYDEENDYIYEWSGGSTFTEMIDYLQNGFAINNLYDNTNEINITITNWFFESENLVMIDNNSIRYELADGIMYINKTYDSIYTVNAENLTLLDITITKTIYKDNIITILLSFVSIVFVGGIILYFYKPLKNGVWHN